MKTYEGPVSGGPLDGKMLSHDKQTYTVTRLVNVSDNFVRTDTGTYNYMRKRETGRGWWQWYKWDNEK